MIVSSIERRVLLLLGVERNVAVGVRMICLNGRD